MSSIIIFLDLSISNSYSIMFVIKSNFAAEQGMLFKWHEWLSSHVWLLACQAPWSVGFIRQELLEWVAIFLPQRIFPTQASNQSLLCLPYCRQILYLLRHQQVQIDIMDALLKYLDAHYKKGFKFSFAGQEISFPAFFWPYN